MGKGINVVQAISPKQRNTWLSIALIALLTAHLIDSLYIAFISADLKYVPSFLMLPLSQWAGDGLNWLAREATFGAFTVRELTRGFAEIVNWPINFLNIILAEGLVTGAGFNKVQTLPPLSWLGLSAALSLYAYHIGGRKLASLTLLGTLYLVFFGLWQNAMTTLASVIMCVVLSAGIGLFIGIASYRRPRTEKFARIIMNVMQTVPIFAYLVPTLLLFGYGPSAALLATVLYALPPMVHATVLALRSVPEEIREYGEIAGSSRHQLLWKVELPVALPMLTVGLNQVVMMSLNMVIIASMIGAGGLGYDVLRALRRLDIGSGLEAGMGIVVLAVILDRLTQAVAKKQSSGPKHGTKTVFSWLYLLIIALATVVSFFVPALQHLPEHLTLTTASFWNEAVSLINKNWFDEMEAVRTFALLQIMNPFRDFLLNLPYAFVIMGLGLIGYVLAGVRLAAGVMAMASFIAVSGLWDPAMISIYLTSCSVIIAVLVGFPIGLYVSNRKYLVRPVSLVLDTLQTLPTFVYLLPAVMLFRNGDFSALIAITFYAIAPAIRYTIHGIKTVPDGRIEAAIMAGCTPWQTFRYVKLPAAFPTLLLGLNQTIMMALSMLVIAALVGTRDLGQEVYIALTRASTGDGIIAGLGIASIALISDSLLKAWAAQKQQQLGVKS